MKDIIQYYKWSKKETSLLFNSIGEYLGISNLQFYMPFFSLYFHVHNTKNSTKRIDLDRENYIRKITEITKQRYYNSNLLLKADIYNSKKTTVDNLDTFCKTIPLVDPTHCFRNNYNLYVKNNPYLPSPYNYNTFSKINNMDNTAYIDVLCSYLFSKLTEKNINPAFALFYGSANGLGDYNYDLSDEYYDIKEDEYFKRIRGKNIIVNTYTSDTEESEESEEETYSLSNSEIGSLSNSEIGSLSNSEIGSLSNSESGSLSNSEVNSPSKSLDRDSERDTYDNEKYKKINARNTDEHIAILKDIPVQLMFIEKLEGTLEDLLDDISDELLLSCLFQISFSLVYLQKHFKFTHNDLHINNVMYQKTEVENYYYKYNNIYFKVPTYGYSFKIIDFGRSIFSYNNKIFMNDVFSKYGEASGQYTYPNSVSFMKNNNSELINPNYSFDMCRLAMTILEDIHGDVHDAIVDLLIHLCTDKNGDNYCEMDSDFNLYIKISKNSRNAVPKDIIQGNLFKIFRVKKNNFPKKTYYTI